jgi:pimeloyl-ACP methyl ester carboxylesterase
MNQKVALAGLLFTLLPSFVGAQEKSKEENVQLQTPTGVLYGTLLLPEKTPAPVALIIAGSGPTDRNGNSPLIPGQNNSLRYLAEGLAQKGIASLRFDKRGIAESMKAATSENELRFTTYVDDAAAWISKLRADQRFTSITVIGHSEGSLIGLMAAPKASADAFVSIAGAGRPAGVVLREQLKAGIPDTAMYGRAVAILAELESGHQVDPIPAEFRVMFRPSVQPYLISWLNLDPAALLGKLEVPALLLQGTTDLQITVVDAQALARGKPKAKLVIIEGMNHILKQAPPERGPNIATYSNSALPVVPQVIDEIAAFIAGLKK